MHLLHVTEAAQVGLQLRLAVSLLDDPFVEFALLTQEFSIAITLSNAARRLTSQFIVTLEQVGDHRTVATRADEPL